MSSLLLGLSTLLSGLIPDGDMLHTVHTFHTML